MHEVVRHRERQVAADRPRGSVDGVRGADGRPRHLTASSPSSTRAERRARRDEAHELAEERLLRMLGVVPFGEVAIDVEQLRRANDEAAPLEAPDDLAEQAALHRVGLDEDERPLHARKSTRLLDAAAAPSPVRRRRTSSPEALPAAGARWASRRTGIPATAGRAAPYSRRTTRSRVVQTGQTR